MEESVYKIVVEWLENGVYFAGEWGDWNTAYQCLLEANQIDVSAGDELSSNALAYGLMMYKYLWIKQKGII